MQFDFKLEEVRAAEMRLEISPGALKAAVSAIREQYAQARRSLANVAIIGHEDPALTNLEREFSGALKRLGEDELARSPGRQLLAAEHLVGKFVTMAAEAAARENEKITRQRAMAHEARMAPMREAARADWARNANWNVFHAITSLKRSLEDIDRRLAAVAKGDETAITIILDDLDHNLKSVRGTVLAARNESRKREADRKATELLETAVADSVSAETMIERESAAINEAAVAA